jgi:hypothetical protein
MNETIGWRWWLTFPGERILKSLTVDYAWEGPAAKARICEWRDWQVQRKSLPFDTVRFEIHRPRYLVTEDPPEEKDQSFRAAMADWAIRCGIYAAKPQSDVLRRYGPKGSVSAEYQHYADCFSFVLGSVALWGTVIEGKRVYCAEHAIIRELFIDPSHQKYLNDFETRYDCPVEVWHEDWRDHPALRDPARADSRA